MSGSDASGASAVEGCAADVAGTAADSAGVGADDGDDVAAPRAQLAMSARIESEK